MGRNFFILLILLAVTGQARAADACDPALSAEEHSQRGVALRDAEDPEAARAQFLCAWQKDPAPRYLARVGLAEKAAGLYPEAAAHLAQALQAADDPFIQQNQQILAQTLAEVRQRLGQLLVTGGMAGAEVLIGGQVVARLPMTEPLYLRPETVTLAVRAPGHLPVERRVLLLPGALSREPVVLLPGAARRPRPPVAKTLGIVALGLGGAFLISGAALFGVRQARAAEYNDDLGRCQDDFGSTRDMLCADLRQQVGLLDQLTTASLVAGGALAVGGSALLIWAYRRKRGATEPKASLLPMTAPGTAGLQLLVRTP